MNLARTRAEQKLTQEGLQDLSGVDQTTISAIETGKNKNPSWDTVRRLSEALGVTPAELFPASAPADGEDMTDEERRAGSDRRSGVERGEGSL